MTALCLDLMDITRDWVSSFVMLCQAFTAADFSCCLFVCLEFCLQQVKYMLDRVKIRRLTLPLQNISLFTFRKTWVAFAVCFGSSSICTEKYRPINFAAFDWILKSIYIPYTSEFFRLLLSSLTLLNTSNAVPLEAKFMPSHCSTMFTYITYIPKRPFMCPLHIQSWLSWKQVNRGDFLLLSY